MSATVDDRIVSLEFENQQFEKGVSESLKTLEKLKQSLKLEEAAQNLSAISDAGKKVDLSTISDSVDRLTERFSTLRMVGLMALSHLVEGALNMAKKIGGALMAPFNQMKSGGWARAANLENAQFQMRGILGSSEKVAVAMKSVDEAVTGTAYSLDEAAKIAAQLTASGVQLGDTLTNSLKSIAGVAAQTNSTFADIGGIFATVKGQGKLMTMQLRQLEARGLNAAATIAKHMGTSEAEIRDMVTKGKISFEEFSEAMSEAFGENAAKANETFDGALSNMKSALNRIGAEFAIPLRSNMIPALNAVRLMINAIKGTMGEVFSIFGRVVTVLSHEFVSRVNNITNFLKNDFKGLENINRALYISMTSIVRIIKTIGDAFRTVFTGSVGDHVNNMAVGMEKLAIALQPTEKGLAGFKTVLVTLFTVIKKVGTAISWLVSHIGGPLFSVALKVTNIIFTIIGRIGNLISIVADVIRNFTDFDSIVKTLGDHGIQLGDKVDKIRVIFERISSVAQKVGKVITSALKGIGVAVAAIVATPIYLLYSAFQKLTTVDWSKFVSALQNAKALIIEFFNKIRQLPIVQSIIDGITTAFFGLVGGIGYVISAVQEGFTKLANGEVTLESIKQKILDIPDVLKDVARKIASYFSGSTIFTNLTNGLDTVKVTISGWVDNIKAKLKDLTPAKVMLIAFSGSMIMLALNANKVVTSLTGLIDTAQEGVSTLVSYFTKEKTPLDKFKEAVLTCVTALGALTAAFVILSKIPNLREVAITLGVFIASMAGIYVLVGFLEKVLKLKDGFKEFVQNMALFSLGVATLSGAMLILSKVPLEGIGKRLVVFTVIVAEMLAASAIVADFGPKGISGMLAMVGFALAVLAVGKALQGLNGVDLSGIEGSWKEITAILIGVALIARALASVGIAVFTGAIAFLLAMKIFSDKLKEVGEEAAENGVKVTTAVEKFKLAIQKVFLNFKVIIETIQSEWAKLSGEVKVGMVAAIAIAVGAIVAVVGVIGRGVIEIGRTGKYIKRAAISFVIIAAAIAGLAYLAKLMSDWIKESGAKSYALAAGIIAGMILVVGGFMALSNLGDPTTIKQVSKLFISLGLVVLSMTAFAAIMGDMDAAQWERANKSLTEALRTIGIFVLLTTIVGSIGKSAKASFGTFAGITLLFSALMGALALLMLNLQSPEDYLKMWKVVGIITALVVLLGGLFVAVSKIRVGTAWKPIAALGGIAIALGGAFTLFARYMPDENYLGKIAAVAGTATAVLTAIILLTGAITHFAKDKRFSVTDTSSKTLKVTFDNIGKLVLSLIGVSLALALLKDADPGQMIKTAGIVVGVITALAAIAVGLEWLVKKFKLKGNIDILITLGALTTIFIALAATMAVLDGLGSKATRLLAVSQTVMLLVAELAAIAVIMSKLAKDGLKALSAVPVLMALTVIFAALALVIAIAERIGGKADRMLAVSQVIMLVLGELVGITAILGVMSTMGLAALASIPTLVGLTVIFAALALVIAIAERIGGKADRMLAVSQVIMLVLGELVGITAILGVMAPLGALALLSLPALIILGAVFTALGLALAVMNKLDLDGALEKSTMLMTVLLQLVDIMKIFAVLSLGAVGMLTGAASMAVLVVSIIGLVGALKALEPISYENISKGLDAVGRALQILLSAGAAAALIAPGLIVLSGAILVMGVGCLAAGAGVLLFANAIQKLAATTPGQLQIMIAAVQGFFTAVGAGVATGIQLILTAVAAGLQLLITVVVNGIKQLKATAINEARGFIPDLVKALFSTGGAEAAANNSGKSIGNAWVQGFRNSKLGWHSPPEVVEAFKKDAAASFKDNGNVIDAIHAGATAAGNQLAEDVGGFKDIISNVDLADPMGSIMQSGGDALNSVLGDSLGSAQSKLDSFLGYFNATSKAMQNSIAGLGTLSDFAYQQQDRLAEARRQVEFYTKKVSEFGHSSLYEPLYQNALKEYDALTKVEEGAEGAANGLDAFTTSSTNAGKASKSAAEDLRSGLESTLTSQMNIFSKFEEKAAMSKEELLANMQSQITGMTNWANNMDKLATMGIDQGLYQKLAEMGPQGAEYVGAFTSMTAEEMAKANELWAQSLVLPGNVAASVSDNFKALGDGTIDGFIGEVAAREGEVTTQMNEVGQVAYDGMHDSPMRFGSPSQAMIEFGFWAMVGLAQGILQNMGHPRRAIETVASVCVSTARARLAPDVFKPIGAGIVQGLQQGIDEQKGMIFTTLEEIARKAIETMKSAKALDEHSPSHKFMQIGEYVPEGLAIGIRNKASDVYSSVEYLSDEAINAMKYTVANIAAQINDSFEDPVITPVLDLSKVQAGVRTLNSTFSANQALSAGSAFNNLQNGQLSGNGNIIFNQVNNSPKALSRIEIYRDTRNLFAQAKGALS